MPSSFEHRPRIPIAIPNQSGFSKYTEPLPKSKKRKRYIRNESSRKILYASKCKPSTLEPLLQHAMPVGIIKNQGSISRGNKDSLFNRYIKLMLSRDCIAYKDRADVSTAVTINRNCALWSVVNKGMTFDEFILYTNNIRKYHRLQLTRIDRFILDLLYNQKIGDGWKGMVDEFVAYINMYTDKCYNVISVVMCMTGYHELWRRVYNETHDMTYRLLFISIFVEDVMDAISCRIMNHWRIKRV